jgi:hypothetical protein
MPPDIMCVDFVFLLYMQGCRIHFRGWGTYRLDSVTADDIVIVRAMFNRIDAQRTGCKIWFFFYTTSFAKFFTAVFTRRMIVKCI